MAHNISGSMDDWAYVFPAGQGKGTRRRQRDSLWGEVRGAEGKCRGTYAGSHGEKDLLMAGGRGRRGQRPGKRGLIA